MNRNEVSGHVTGSVTQVGVVHGDLHVTKGLAVRSRYLGQVERLAPADLEGRRAELDELTAFCTSRATAGRYAWWRAEAWSGKSALLSRFVLDPPDGVHLVSFFVTSRLAGHNDRRGFADNVMDQLLAFLEEPPLANLTDATREEHLLGLLDDAAERCQQRGEHFALVVDGLDEDRGAGGEDSHSIAALLPTRLLYGMRVIVTGRPNPPIPYDVPNDHPLRDPAIVRPLSPSPKARMVREVMERDLRRLHGGTPAEQALLGLLAGAGGGLTTSDLAELTGASKWDVEKSLGTVTGRSFVSRPGDRRDGSEVHLLAHEELQATAVRMLGPRLGEHQKRIHDWAESYRDQRWPASTPDYLLGGYFALLTAIPDLGRVIACATDPHRRNRLWASTGGDGAALSEITTAQSFLRGLDQPDLTTLVRLAVHRGHLYQHTGRLPLRLPAGWARVGDVERAESMLDAIQDPGQRVEALRMTAAVLHRMGRGELAEDLVDRAEQAARSINQFFGAPALRSVVLAFSRIGRLDRARTTVGFIEDRLERARALTGLAREAVDDGDLPRATTLLTEAERLIRAERPESRLPALVELAQAVVLIGDRARAVEFLDEAEESLPKGGPRFTVEGGGVAVLAAALGDHDRAVRLTNLIDSAVSREHCLLSVIATTAEHDPGRAEAIARTTGDAALLCTRLARIGEVLASKAGEEAGVGRLIAEVESSSQEIPDLARRSAALMSMAEVMAAFGDLRGAEAVAREHALLCGDSEAVMSIAAAVLRADDLVRGADLLDFVEQVGRAEVSPVDERRSLLWIRTMVEFGDFDRAESAAETIREPVVRSAAWALVAEGEIGAGLVDRGEVALRRVDESSHRRRPRLELVRVVMAAGDFVRAAAIARSATDLRHRIAALTIVAEASRDGALLDEVEAEIDSLPRPVDRLDPLTALLAVAANLADRGRMTALLDLLRDLAQEVVVDEGQEGFELVDAAVLSATRARILVRRLSEPMRTFTEVLAVAAQPDRFDPHDVADTGMPPRPMADPGRTRLPPEQALVRDLVELDWHDVVETLVELHRETYPVIVAELDLLAGL